VEVEQEKENPLVQPQLVELEVLVAVELEDHQVYLEQLQLQYVELQILVAVVVEQLIQLVVLVTTLEDLEKVEVVQVVQVSLSQEQIIMTYF
jgi:hypothetical protein